MGVSIESINRAIAEGNKVLKQLERVCPYSNEYQSDCEVQSPKSERDQAPALGSPISRETKSDRRIIVRFIGYRCRPLDPDNFAGGCKDLLDALRHAKLIEGDEPDKIIFVTEQKKVDHRSEERTEIELIG